MTIYYVDQTGGNDGWGGTFAAPWKTLAKVQATIIAGDEALLKCGETWAEMLTIPASNIRIGNYGSGAQPIVTGSDLRNNCILSDGKNNIIIDGIKATAAVWETIYIKNSANSVIKNCTATDTKIGITFEDSINIYVYNNIVSLCDNDGISANDCIGGTISDNNVSVCGVVTDDRSGISLFMACAGISVHDNVCYDSVNVGAVGIRGIIVDTVGNTGTNYVYQNKCYNNDGGGIEIYLSNNQVVHTNICYDNGDVADWFDGICMHDCTGGVVYNNTCYGNRNSSIRCRDAFGCTIKNNIGWQIGNSCFITEAGGATSHIVDYNNWYGVANEYDWNGTTYATSALFYAATGQGQHDFTTDPLCVGVADYHLQAGSPCRGAGVNVGMTEDYDGMPIPPVPDIGAYQYPFARVIVVNPPRITRKGFVPFSNKGHHYHGG